ncbi:type I-E CRISPR-associated endoribonuclease Cas2e [Azospirillum soli]|uniref:type I-E CRISPR-associated endoribonuclease Cas2e n=1 Tax=Azospirillum soli TaxID=1304799 RepID=UPI001AE5FE29|nr:type I-E CRISPR-associated endoribonuclease Cas2e [Azospirillum soli]MBP2315534.1 CRISPR-associated protein Cas2 [Azospirillum soli]
MLVIVLEAAPPRLRGRLALWLLEVRAGVYVGRASPRLRDRLWDEIVANIEDGNAVLVEANSSLEAGFTFRTAGRARRMPLDSDGYPLVAFHPEGE